MKKLQSLIDAHRKQRSDCVRFDVSFDVVFFVFGEETERLKDVDALKCENGEGSSRVHEPTILDLEGKRSLLLAVNFVQSDEGRFERFVASVSFVSVGAGNAGFAGFQAFVAQAFDDDGEMRVDADNFRLSSSLCGRLGELQPFRFAHSFFNLVREPRFGEGEDDRRVVVLAQWMSITEDPFQFLLSIGACGEEDIFGEDVGFNEGALGHFGAPFSTLKSIFPMIIFNDVLEAGDFNVVFKLFTLRLKEIALLDCKDGDFSFKDFCVERRFQLIDFGEGSVGSGGSSGGHRESKK